MSINGSGQEFAECGQCSGLFVAFMVEEGCNLCTSVGLRLGAAWGYEALCYLPKVPLYPVLLVTVPKRVSVEVLARPHPCDSGLAVPNWASARS
jgi:hypothetical protein